MCAPGRWRKGPGTGQPALPAGYFKSFQGIVSDPVGFSLHKNKVRVGRLHDGVVLHHTVDTWTQVSQKGATPDLLNNNKQNLPDFLKSFAKT